MKNFGQLICDLSKLVESRKSEYGSEPNECLKEK